MRITPAAAQMANRTTVTVTFHAKLIAPPGVTRTCGLSLLVTLCFRNAFVNHSGGGRKNSAMGGARMEA
jgi:hypothetical protein